MNSLAVFHQSKHLVVYQQTWLSTSSPRLVLGMVEAASDFVHLLIDLLLLVRLVLPPNHRDAIIDILDSKNNLRFQSHRVLRDLGRERL